MTRFGALARRWNHLARSTNLAVLKSGYAETMARRIVPLGGTHERPKYPSVLFQQAAKFSARSVLRKTD